jgi:hypothetical protein
MLRWRASSGAQRPSGILTVWGTRAAATRWPRLHAVMLHVDRVVDHRSPASSTNGSDGSWPPTYCYDWMPGVHDGDDGPLPVRELLRDPRILRRFDHSPPSGVGSASDRNSVTSVRRTSGEVGGGGGGFSNPTGLGHGGGASGPRTRGR